MPATRASRASRVLSIKPAECVTCRTGGAVSGFHNRCVRLPQIAPTRSFSIKFNARTAPPFTRGGCVLHMDMSQSKCDRQRMSAAGDSGRQAMSPSCTNDSRLQPQTQGRQPSEQEVQAGAKRNEETRKSRRACPCWLLRVLSRMPPVRSTGRPRVRLVCSYTRPREARFMPHCRGA